MAGRDQSHGWLRRNLYLLSACASAGPSRGPRSPGLLAGQGRPFPSPQACSGILQFALKPRAQEGQGEHLWVPHSETLRGACAVAKTSPRAGGTGRSQGHPPRQEQLVGGPGKTLLLMVDAGSMVPTPAALWCGAILCGLLPASPFPQGLRPHKTSPPESLLRAQRPDPKSCSRAQHQPSLSPPRPLHGAALGSRVPAAQRPFPVTGSRMAVTIPSGGSSQSPAPAPAGLTPRLLSLMVHVSAELRWGRAVLVIRLVGGAFSGSQCGPAGGR